MRGSARGVHAVHQGAEHVGRQSGTGSNTWSTHRFIVRCHGSQHVPYVAPPLNSHAHLSHSQAITISGIPRGHPFAILGGARSTAAV